MGGIFESENLRRGQARGAGRATRLRPPGSADRGAQALLDQVFPEANLSASPSTPALSAATQSLLADALAELCEETDAERGAIWAADGSAPEASPGGAGDGRALVVAARGFAGGRVLPADPEAMALLEQLDGPVDLGDPDLPERLAQLPRSQGLTAACPILLGEARRPAVLLLGGEPAGGVRPRTLLKLAATAERLRAPLHRLRERDHLHRLSTEVQQLDRLASLGEVVAEIAHELRNPMVALKTFLQLVPERHADPEFREDFRGMVNDELLRMERLLSQLIQHARPADASAAPTGHPPGELLDVEAALDIVQQLLAYRCRQRGIRFELAIEVPVVRIPLSMDAFRQIALNLVLNAIAVTPPEGRVRIEAREAKDETTVPGFELCVDDSGPGIDPELRERIFEPFFTTRTGQTGGLGLAISRRLAESAGGDLVAEDSPGGGARMRLRTPFA